MDPTQLTADNWPQALVFVVLIVCVVALPTILTARGNKNVREIAAEFRNNGGSTAKDALDRIEDKLTEHLEWSDEYQKTNAEQFTNIDRRLTAMESKKRRLFKR